MLKPCIHKSAISACLAAMLIGTAAIAQDSQPADSNAPTVVVCRITDVIDPGTVVVVKRALAEAKQLNAAAVAFRIDTPGGRVDSAVEIATAIMNARCKTIAYVEGMGAISAGALISFACDEIIMASGSAIGAATPVIPTPQGMAPTGEKEISFMRAKMRSLAESKGHSPDLAQAMVDKDIELRGYVDAEGKYRIYTATPAQKSQTATKLDRTAEKTKNTIEDLLRILMGDVPQPRPDTPEVDQDEETPAIEAAPNAEQMPDGSEVIVPSGKLLTLTPNEAQKYGLIPTVVDGFEMALAHYGLSAAHQHFVQPNWAEKTFRFLTNPTIAGLLLMIGLGAIYYEVKVGGIGFPAVIGVAALTLFFGANLVLGLADTIDLVLILSGIALLALEIFVIPGFGIAGIAGIFCLIIGTYLSLVDFTVPEYSWQYERLNQVLYTFTVAIVAFAVFVIASWKLLPNSPIYGALVLKAAQHATDGYTAPAQDATHRIGLRGTSLSMLRPVGRARFGGETLQVVTRGDFIAENTPVEIIEVDGARIVVDRVEGAA